MVERLIMQGTHGAWSDVPFVEYRFDVTVFGRDRDGKMSVTDIRVYGDGHAQEDVWASVLRELCDVVKSCGGSMSDVQVVPVATVVGRHADAIYETIQDGIDELPESAWSGEDGEEDHWCDSGLGWDVNFFSGEGGRLEATVYPVLFNLHQLVRGVQEKETATHIPVLHVDADILACLRKGDRR